MILELEPAFNNIGYSKSFSAEYDLSDLVFDVDNPFKRPVSVDGMLCNEAGIVKIHATAKCLIDSFCVRCMDELHTEMSVPVEHILVTSLNNEENDEFILVSEMRFDLEPLVREDIILAYPTVLLCSDDCKGLCSGCGKNLNTEKCLCKKTVDPRFAALTELLEDSNDE